MTKKAVPQGVAEGDISGGDTAASTMIGGINPGSRHGGPQVVRGVGPHPRFDAAARQRFVDALSLSCNVSLAAERAGYSLGTVYRVRSHDPVFAEQWREALSLGLERLEALVVEHGGAGLPLEPADPDRAQDAATAPPPFDFEKAMRALQLHAKFRAGVARKVRKGAATAADTDAAIIELLRKLRVRAVAERAPAPAPDSAPDSAPDPAPDDAPDGGEDR